MPVCVKKISSWVRKVWCMAMTCMSLGTLQGAAASAALATGVSLVSILQVGDAHTFYSNETLFFNIYHYCRSTKIGFSLLLWDLASSHIVGKCWTLTYINSCRYVGLSGSSSPPVVDWVAGWWIYSQSGWQTTFFLLNHIFTPVWWAGCQH